MPPGILITRFAVTRFVPRPRHAPQGSVTISALALAASRRSRRSRTGRRATAARVESRRRPGTRGTTRAAARHRAGAVAVRAALDALEGRSRGPRRRRPPANSTLSVVRRSPPRCGPARLEAVPRKNASKMSPKPPKPSKPEKPCWPLPATPGEAVAVVRRALLRVGEHLVGGGDLLELVLGALVLVAVGVELHRQPAERALDVLLRRVAGDTHHLVELVLCAGHDALC